MRIFFQLIGKTCSSAQRSNKNNCYHLTLRAVSAWGGVSSHATAPIPTCLPIVTRKLTVSCEAFRFMNLWHLFATGEFYKLRTFLAGGLWCSDLGSIVGFGDDRQGSGVQGVFVSCWHQSEGDPTSSAWEIFGGKGRWLCHPNVGRMTAAIRRYV